MTAETGQESAAAGEQLPDCGLLFPPPRRRHGPVRRVLAGLVALCLVKAALGYLDDARDLLRVAAGEDD